MHNATKRERLDNRSKFERLINEFMVSEGARETTAYGIWPAWEVDTICGKLTLHVAVPLELLPEPGLTVFGRFADWTQASEILDVGQNGKWNHHFGNDDARESANVFMRHFARISAKVAA